MPLYNPPDKLLPGCVQRPNQMPRYIVPSANIYATNAANPANAATFWTFWANAGVTVNTDFAANTYKTIANVSGAGEFVAALGPTYLGVGADITDFRITIDGVQYVESISIESPNRAFIGSASVSGTAANSGMGFGTPAFTYTNTSRKYAVPGQIQVIAPTEARTFNLPRIRFEATLLVEMRVQAANSDTAAFGRRSGVNYLLD